MGKFSEIKQIVNEHDKCLEKSRIIQNGIKAQREGLKKVMIKDVDGEGVYLSTYELKVLNNCIYNQGLKLENKIQDLFNSDKNNSEPDLY